MSDSDELEEILNQFSSKKQKDKEQSDTSKQEPINEADANDEAEQISSEKTAFEQETEEDLTGGSYQDEHQFEEPEYQPADDNIQEQQDNLEEVEDAPEDSLFDNVNDSDIHINDVTADEPKDEYVDISSGVEYADNYPEDNMGENKSKKGIIIAVVAIIVVAAIAVGVYFGVIKKDKGNDTPTTVAVQTTETTVAPENVVNPLTGDTDFNSSAVGKRPVACVVENSEAARPQWGINTPDIIVEGEVEGGETRMLWLYADYTSMPEQIGPMRSARPPYIRFSQLFDSIFIHWGMSKSKGSYVGADSVFKELNVDHINQMTYSGNVALYGRDKSRSVAVEHTGVLYGNKVADAIKGQKFRTDANDAKYTKFTFSEESAALSDATCDTLGLKFSSRTATRDWTYSTDDKMYHCNDYKTDVKMKNLIVLFDTTEYVSKANYKGSGNSETYCNYGLKGGKGVIASEGSYVNITWSVVSGKIEIKDESGKDVSLNQGRSWIGYGSSNNGGTVTEK